MEEHTKTRPSLGQLIEEGKNKQNMYCIQCPSRILNSGVGIFKEINVSYRWCRNNFILAGGGGGIKFNN